MSVFTPVQRARVEAAVKEAESRTSAEFLCATMRATDTYLTVPLLLAAAIALALPMTIRLVTPGWSGITIGDPGLTLLQVLVFAACALIGAWTPIAVRLTPRRVRQRRFARTAAAVFLEQGLAGVSQRNGVLLFVALAEHQVEVIADRQVYERVDPRAWTEIVGDFTAAVKRGDVADGYVAALRRLGSLLEDAYPRAEDDVNEITDRLVELD
jgi:putative membrane protein